MDNREYLRRLCHAKQIITALAVMIITCLLSFVAAAWIEDKRWSAIVQGICALIMFSRLFSIGNCAAQIASDLQKEPKAKPGSGKKQQK